MSEPQSFTQAAPSLPRRRGLMPGGGGRTREEPYRRRLEPDVFTCLLVVDNPRYAELYALKLELDGYHVRRCERVDALESVRQARPSLVFLDVQEHLEEAVELHRRLRQDRRSASTPVILISELCTRALEEIGYSFGALDLVVKPMPQAIALSTAVSDDAPASTPWKAQGLSARGSAAGNQSDAS